MNEATSARKLSRAPVSRVSAFLSSAGAGGVVMGVTALMAATLASACPAKGAWLVIWLVEACLAISLGSLALAKRARKIGLSLPSYPGPRFAICFTPPLFVGAVITCRLLLVGNLHAVIVTWLLLYGVAILSGGKCSQIVAPQMGVGFLTVGMAALLLPPEWLNLPLAIGFGGLHITFGIIRFVRGPHFDAIRPPRHSVPC